MYVSVVRHLVFRHTKQPPLMQLSVGMTHHSAVGGGGGGAPQRRPDTAERERLFWDRFVGERLSCENSSVLQMKSGLE